MRSESPNRKTLTVEEAAAALGVSRSTAYEAARLYLATDGEEGLPVIRLGHRMLVPAARLDRMLGS